MSANRFSTAFPRRGGVFIYDFRIYGLLDEDGETTPLILSVSFGSFFLLRLGLGLINHLDVFGRALVEILQAAFAAKLDFTSLVDIHKRLAHLAQLVAG